METNGERVQRKESRESGGDKRGRISTPAAMKTLGTRALVSVLPHQLTYCGLKSLPLPSHTARAQHHF